MREGSCQSGTRWGEGRAALPAQARKASGSCTGGRDAKRWILQLLAPLFPRSVLLCPAEVCSEERGREEASVAEIS